MSFFVSLLLRQTCLGSGFDLRDSLLVELGLPQALLRSSVAFVAVWLTALLVLEFAAFSTLLLAALVPLVSYPSMDTMLRAFQSMYRRKLCNDVGRVNTIQNYQACPNSGCCFE